MLIACPGCKLDEVKGRNGKPGDLCRDREVTLARIFDLDDVTVRNHSSEAFRFVHLRETRKNHSEVM